MVALGIALPVVVGLLLVIGLVTFFYVFASFTVLWYDQRLSRFGFVSCALASEKEPKESVAKSHDKQKRYSWLRTFLAEYGSTLLCVLTYPFGWLLFHPKSPRGKKQNRPVLLVHGLRHNQSAWLFHRRRLRRAGLGPIYTLNLVPLNGSIKSYASLVADKAAQIEQETGTSDLSLVGHSMGGLVCAYYSERLAPYGKVSRLVTLGTPLFGTRSAVLSTGPAARQMRPGSDLLEEIEHAVACSKLTTYYHLASLRDNIVLPNHAAWRGMFCDRERVLAWQGHMTLLFSSDVSNQLIQWLTEPVSASRRVATATVSALAQQR